MSHFDRFVGIDIAKNRLDIYCHPDGLAFCVANPSEWYRPAAAKAGGGGVAFGCEATGGYEDLLLVTLSQAGTPGYCLHPADILAFARLKGKRAKTDARDAKAMALALVAAVTADRPPTGLDRCDNISLSGACPNHRRAASRRATASPPADPHSPSTPPSSPERRRTVRGGPHFFHGCERDRVAGESLTCRRCSCR